MKWMTDQLSQKRIEEVSMKWIDRQIAKKREIIPFLTQRAKKASAKGQNPPHGRTF